MIQWFGDLNIRIKLFISYLLLLTLSSSLFISVNSYITAKNTEKQSRYSLEVILQQSSSFLNFKTSAVRNVIDIMVIHDTIQTIVNAPSTVYKKNIGNWMLDEYFFNQLIFNVQTNPDIQNISLYMRDGMAAVQSSDQFMLLPSEMDTPWLQRVVGENSSYIWLPSSSMGKDTDDSITFIRKITSPLESKSFSGLLRAEMPKLVLVRLLDQSLFTKSTSALLVNRHHELIASSSENHVTNLDSIVEKMPFSADSQHIEMTTLNGEKTLLASIPIENTDWRFILVVPHKDIVAISEKSRNQLLIITLAIALLTFPMAYYVSSSGTLRIRKLSKTMRKVGVDDYKAQLDPKNKDEIGELTQTFNHMITRIDDLASEKYQLGLDVKNMELRALQAQINPHFLYNTLDLVNWLAMKYKAEDIRTLITTLSDFYKISLSNGEDMISIRAELNHVSAYVLIQNMRFRDRISLQIDVPDEICSQLTLKLILQPLVENAILHGIMEKESQMGSINIRGRISQVGIELTVEDDGVGMDKATVKEIMNGTLKRGSGGYGMKNIHHRLQIMFGYPFGLIVESNFGVGTRVIVQIPINWEHN